MMMMNYYMQNDDDIDGECMYDNEDENDDNLLIEHVYC